MSEKGLSYLFPGNRSDFDGSTLPKQLGILSEGSGIINKQSLIDV